MPLLKSNLYTSEDYWNLPEDERTELIDGKLYAMAPPSILHQHISVQLCKAIGQYIDSHSGKCKVLSAPVAVNLNADDTTYVEPDILIVCDPSKLGETSIKGAPDFIAEIVSPSSRKMDYVKKAGLYLDSGVREYWIVDPAKEHTTIYRYEEDAAPIIIPFDQTIQVGIYSNLKVTISELL